MNLLELIKDKLTASAISHIGDFLGEDTEKVSSGLTAALPAILGGFMQKASTTQGAGDLLNLIKNDTQSNGFSDNFSRLFSNGNLTGILTAGSGLLSSLFGEKTSALAALVANSSGLGSKSSSSLLNLAAPLVLGVLGNQVKSQGLGISGLASLLMSQKDSVKSALPAGIGSILSIGSLGDFLGDVRQNVSKSYESVEDETRGGFSKLLPWILLGFLILGGLYFWKSCQNKATEAAVVIDSTAAEVSDKASVMMSSVSKTLSTGIQLNFSEFSIENELIIFIEDTNRLVDKDTWFNFRNLTFESNSAVIDAGSQKEVENIAEILKAFPDVNIKVGGYTDNTGSDQINTKLSSDRAANVVAALVAKGIAASRLESEGYGPQHPIATNDTEEGRNQNRRIAVRVTKK